MTGHVTCSNCGFINAPGAQFCGNCAAPLQIQPPEAPQAIKAVYCPYCEQPNPIGAPYCGHCGQSLAATPAPDQARTAVWTLCPHCGRTNPLGATFCGECGRSLAPTSAPPPTFEPEEEKKRLGGCLIPIIVLAALVFLGAIAAIVFFEDGIPLPAAVANLLGRNTTTVTAESEATDAPPAEETGPAPEETEPAIEPPLPTATASPGSAPTAPPTLTPFPPPTRIEPTATPTTNPTGTPDRGPEALVLGATSRGTPIEAVRFGNGPRTVMFIGGLAAGFAPSTVALAEAAADHFTRNPDLIPESLTVFIVLSASPDAPVAPGNYSGRLNANGVDINRNWDCQWAADTLWQGELKRGSGGTAPFSEAESRILRDFIVAEDAAAVIFWQARAEGGLASPGGCGEGVEVSAALAGVYGLSAGYRVENFEDLTRQILNGDASNYLDSIGVPAVSVLLPSYSSSIDWENNLRGILAVLDAYAN
jgi:hypothetical protein